MIPPIPALRDHGVGDFHLLLSHLLGDPRYLLHYKQQRENGAYLVLDNSAHEHGAGDNAGNLALCAKELNAQEVVVPDVLEKAEATADAAVTAHETWHEGMDNTMRALDPALMYVPQGENYEAWQLCLTELVAIHAYASNKYGIRRDFVLGISKDYEVWDGGVLKLLQEDIFPLRATLLKEGIRVNVHLLGWGRHLWRLEEIAVACPWVRSTDSAKPFVYALKGIELMDAYIRGEVPNYPRRPKNYFSRHMQQATLAQRNADLFKSLASGRVRVG